MTEQQGAEKEKPGRGTGARSSVLQKMNGGGVRFAVNCSSSSSSSDEEVQGAASVFVVGVSLNRALPYSELQLIRTFG